MILSIRENVEFIFCEKESLIYRLEFLIEEFNLKKSFLSKKSAMLFINKLNYLEKKKLEDLSMARKWLKKTFQNSINFMKILKFKI